MNEMLAFLATVKLNYLEWLSVISALKTMGWQQYQAIDWSSSIAGYETNHGVTDAKWNSLRPMAGGEGVIINLAREKGFDRWDVMHNMQARCKVCGKRRPIVEMKGEVCSLCR